MAKNMFNSNKKIQCIDYQGSNFHQQKRKSQQRKWLMLAVLVTLLILLLVAFMPLAQSNNIDHQLKTEPLNHTQNLLINGPQLLFNHPDKKLKIALPIDINADIEINGLMAYTQIKQVFINPYNLELEGKYQFPLPDNAAIKQLTVKVGDKEIVGKIMEKKAAKAVYNRAKRQGKKASLVQQQRANLFTNNIANIPAHSTVVVTLTFIMPVTFVNNKLSINLPLAITRRYQPTHYQNSPAEQVLPTQSPLPYALVNKGSNESSLVERPNNINVNSEYSKVLAKSQAAINIKLDAGVEVSSVSSASHSINTKALNSQQSQYLISLAKVQAPANRNFNLTWQLQPNQQTQVSSFTEQIDDEYFTLLTFFPPSVDKAPTFSRDIIFIIDTSGSMQGNSMTQAKYSLQQAISLLNDDDSFNIIAFDSTVDLLFSKTQMVSEANINKAQKFISNLQADGGTEMYRPLSQALVMAKNSKQSPQAIRQVVFITDGAVTNEFELMQLLDSAEESFRLFTVGIGAAPNGYFMKKAAQFGRGDYLFIQNINEIQERVSALMAKISQPAVSNIELIVDNQVHQQVDVYPKKIADLYRGEPMQVAIRSTLPINSIQLHGDTASQPWYHQLIIADSQSAHGVSTVWARSKIEDLLDTLVTGADKTQVKQQVIATSISHQIISPYTSFIAIEKPTEASPLLATQKHKSVKSPSKMPITTSQDVTVSMPKTALGWQQTLLCGLLLILLAPITLRFWPK